MGADDIKRLEGKVDDVLTNLANVGATLASLDQWRTDKREQCERHERGIEKLRDGAADEIQARTLAVAKVEAAIGRRIGAQAMVAALVGALIPGMVLLVKFWPTAGG
jgi:hypothetical protein